MPTYEYACRSCGNHLEVVQSFSDDPLTECPSCHQGQLKKVFSPVGISFKGSGFYKTDSRSKRSSASSSSDSTTKGSGSTDAGTKDSGSTDSGPKDSKGSGASEAKTA